MFSVNGSDTDWLVYADYLEDQGIDASHIREGIVHQQPNWTYEGIGEDGVGSRNPTVGSGYVGGRDLVGGGFRNDVGSLGTLSVANEICGGVGGNYYIYPDRHRVRIFSGIGISSRGIG